MGLQTSLLATHNPKLQTNRVQPAVFPCHGEMAPFCILTKFLPPFASAFLGMLKQNPSLPNIQGSFAAAPGRDRHRPGCSRNLLFMAKAARMTMQTDRRVITKSCTKMFLFFSRDSPPTNDVEESFILTSRCLRRREGRLREELMIF
jgi:hypothetical protein